MSQESQEFKVATLMAMHIQNIPPLLNGFVAPKLNVATMTMGAVVLEGADLLLDGNTKDYDLYRGYASHELHNDEDDSEDDDEDNYEDKRFLIKLGQPYYIESMRMLLLDLDERSYQFYIETSLDNENWTMVADKRKEYSRSWQTLTFEPILCMYIEIVGTYSTVHTTVSVDIALLGLLFVNVINFVFLFSDI